jgi:hypothetical protein
MRGEELQVGRSPAARTVCVASSSIYWVMSALSCRAAPNLPRSARVLD